MKKAIGVGLLLLGLVVALNFLLPLAAQAENQQPPAANAKDLLLEKVEQAKALLGENKYDEAEQAFLGARDEAAAAKIDLGYWARKAIDNGLASIREKRLQMKRDALMGRFAAAEALFGEAKYTQALAGFVAVEKDAEAQQVNLGFWNTRKLNSYISKCHSLLDEAAKNAKEAEAAAAAEKQRSEAEATKAGLLTKFQEGESLFKQGKYREAKPILQEVSDAAAAKGISFGYTTDHRLRSYLAESDTRIIEAAKAETAAKAAEAQDKVKGQLANRFADGETLYKEGKYAEAKAIFVEIQKTEEAQNVSLGFLKDRAVASYISKSDKAMAEAEAAAAEKKAAQEKAAKEASEQGVREAETKKAADEKAAKAAESQRLAEEAKVAAQKEEQAKAKLLTRLADAEALYKAGKYSDAKAAFEGIRVAQQTEGVSLGYFKDRAVESGIAKSDKAIAQAEEDAKVAEAKRLGDEKAAKEAEAQTAKAAEAKRLAEEKAAKETEAQTAKAAEAKRLADEKAAKEAEVQAAKTAEAKRLADEKAAKEAEVQTAKAAEAKRLADEKAAREVAAAKETQMKADLQKRFSDAEALYDGGKYAEAKAAFEGIKKDEEAANISLGFFKDRAIASYISKSDKAMAEAEVAAAKKKAADEAEAKKAEERRVAQETAAKQAEAAHAAAQEKQAEDQRRAELKTKLLSEFDTAQALYKAGRYAEAKPLLLDVKSESESSGIDLGFFNTRSLRSCLASVDAKIAQTQAKTVAAAPVAVTVAPPAEEPTAKAPAVTEPVAPAAPVMEEPKAPEAPIAKTSEAGPEKAPEAAPSPAETVAPVKSAEKAEPAVRTPAEAATKARAEASYREALAAYRSGDYKAAEDGALQALSIKPDYDEATILLENVKNKIAQAKTPENDFAKQTEVRVQATRNEILGYIENARRSMDEKKYVAAENFAQQAKVTAEGNIQMGFEQYAKEADDLMKEIAPLAEEEKASTARATQAEAHKALAVEEKLAHERSAQLVRTYMASANEHIKAEDYEAAAADLDAVLKIQPDYAYARVLRELVGQWQTQAANRTSEDKRLEAVRKIAADTTDQLVFSISPVMQYPPHWIEKMSTREQYIGTPQSQEFEMQVRRKRQLATPQASLDTQEVQRKLQTRLKYFNFSGQPFPAMIEFLKSVSGDLNIYVDPRVAPTNEQTITLQLTDTPLKDVLDLVTQQVGLQWTVRNGMVYISDESGIATYQPTDTEMVIVYDIRDLISPIADTVVAGATGGRGGAAGGAAGGRGAAGAGGASTGGAGAGAGSGGAGGSGRRFGGGASSAGEGVSGAGGALGGALGGEGRAEGRSTTGSTGRSGGTGRQGMATDTNGEDLAQLIMSTVDPNKWLGTEDYIVRYYTGGKLIVRALPEQQQHVVDFLAQLREMRSIYVLVDQRTITVSTAWLNTFVSGISKPGITDTAAKLPGFNAIAEETHTPFTTLNATWDAGSAPTSGPLGLMSEASAFTFNYDFLDGIELAGFIEAAEQESDTEVMQMPRVTLANGQLGGLDVSTTTQYIANESRTQSIFAGPPPLLEITITRTMSSFVSGTTLSVRPTVSYDRRYVQLDLFPNITELVSKEDIPTEDGGFFSLLTTQESSLYATVSVPDGGTAFLGGLAEASETLQERGVPILSKLPVIGKVFRSKGTIRERRSKVFLVTPYIIIRDEYESRL